MKRSSTDPAPHECRGRLVRGPLLAANALIRLYQLTLGAVKPACCRYQPTCSEYTRLAILAHGPLRGVWLGARRIGRCHPWGGFGYDPVPERGGRRPDSAPQPDAVGDATP